MAANYQNNGFHISTDHLKKKLFSFGYLFLNEF